MEDIVLDFNGNYQEPNNIEAWWPASGTDNELSFGYLSGISIETNNVVIDLNGYELKMSKGFYLQQKYFSNIMIESDYSPV